jgi:hypothetical protein
MKLKLMPFIGLLVFGVACSKITGEEIARIKISEISREGAIHWKSTTVDLKADEKVYFWTDMNLEFEGPLAMRYQIQLIKDADTLGLIELDPFEKDITIGEIKTTLNDKTNWRYSGRMDFHQIKEAGKYTFRTRLVTSPNRSLQLKQADLVLKK